ncbi:hypothetical protein D9615_008835 [Tricholomella constricta]|uniref:Uncharacterized protein n=1 Tax=Tricholomella constricta TaxID=117010 RepID=A0A8H5H0B9_9AGAR|nr:hypothetical protein D9615_008835 [Tricholomella constricta]
MAYLITPAMTLDQKADYLRTLPAIRENCTRVHHQGKLEYFDYHPDKEADVAAFCIKAKSPSPSPSIYPHLTICSATTA